MNHEPASAPRSPSFFQDESPGQQKISAKEFTIDSAVDLVQTDDGGFGVAVELHGTMPGVDDDKAAELMHTAHKVCPYSKATRGNIDVRMFVGDRPV